MTNLKLGKRKIIAIKNSRLITLPLIWIDSLGIKTGDKIEIVLVDNKLVLSK